MYSELRQFLSAIDRPNSAQVRLFGSNTQVLVESEVGPVGIRLARGATQMAARVELIARRSIPAIREESLDSEEMCQRFMRNYAMGENMIGTVRFFLPIAIGPHIWYVAAMRFEYTVSGRKDVGLEVFSPGPVDIVPVARNVSLRQKLEARSDR